MFFEALNYETIEQKKAYEVAGLLGEFRPCFQSGILLRFGDINSHIICIRVLSTLNLGPAFSRSVLDLQGTSVARWVCSSAPAS